MSPNTTTGMPRGPHVRTERTEAVVFWIAFGISALFGIAQVAFAVAFVPVMLYAYETAGMSMPGLLSFADALGPFGIVAVFSVLDIGTFAVFVGAARKYWQGLLFIPPLMYLLFTLAMLASGVSGAAVIFNR